MAKYVKNQVPIDVLLWNGSDLLGLLKFVKADSVSFDKKDRLKIQSPLGHTLIVAKGDYVANDGSTVYVINPADLKANYSPCVP